jgi:hypothetical protein
MRPTISDHGAVHRRPAPVLRESTRPKAITILLAENIRLKSENSMLTDRLNIVEQQAVMIAIEKV